MIIIYYLKHKLRILAPNIIAIAVFVACGHQGGESETYVSQIPENNSDSQSIELGSVLLSMASELDAGLSAADKGLSSADAQADSTDLEPPLEDPVVEDPATAVEEPVVEEPVVEEPPVYDSTTKSFFEPANVSIALIKGCNRCHDWVEIEQTVLQKSTGSLNRIQSGNMPPGNLDWRNTADGKLVVEWLESLN